MKYRWKPNAQQKREYHERMVAIESQKRDMATSEYFINCTGDCCKGDKIIFFNAAKSKDPIYGEIINESYGSEKGQHTFIIETDSDIVRIKGRNLYKNNVFRKPWDDEKKRELVLIEKHERGDEVRRAKQNKFNLDYLKEL